MDDKQYVLPFSHPMDRWIADRPQSLQNSQWATTPILRQTRCRVHDEHVDSLDNGMPRVNEALCVVFSAQKIKKSQNSHE